MIYMEMKPGCFMFEKWNIEEIGYKPITTFWDDFCIADAFGVDGVRDTYNRAFNEWKWNYKYLTELVLVLNHKSWRWYNANDELATLYTELCEEADKYAMDNLSGEEMDYYIETTD